MNYRILKDYPNYKIFEDGTVIRTEHKSKKGRFLKEKKINPHTSKNKYKMLSLHDKDGKNKQFYLHRLVFEAFFGDIPETFEIDHINGNRADCSIKNLRMCTHKQNCNNPQSIENYKRANARDKGKYDYERLCKASKVNDDMFKRTYMLLLVKHGSVSVMDLMEEGHCGYPRAMRIINSMNDISYTC